MKTLEYRTVDKSAWGSGPWRDEPDKVQWVDPATNLPCLIVRGPMGALCGYVGVSKAHPLYEIDYNRADEMDDAKVIHVHGGLTFAGPCQPNAAEDHGICHTVEPGEDDAVWWLGFDCAHHNDFIPIRNYGFDWEIYRDVAYVRDQVTNLASQLNSWGK